MTTMLTNSMVNAMEKEQFGVSPSHWAGLSEEERELYRIIRPMRTCNYTVSVDLHNVKRELERQAEQAELDGGVFNLNPDFQRGHVWSREKQIGYVENLLRGTAPLEIKFNCAKFHDFSAEATGMHGYDMVCVDGLQRLTAVVDFMDGKFKIFGGRYDEASLLKTAFSPRRKHLLFQIYDVKDYGDLIQFYLDLNTGGVVHEESELDRVRKLQQEYQATK